MFFFCVEIVFFANDHDRNAPIAGKVKKLDFLPFVSRATMLIMAHAWTLR